MSDTRILAGRGLDEFLEDSRQIVGQPAQDVPEGTNVADVPSLRGFCGALNDKNPLYADPNYGAISKYNSMVAPPTFVISVRTPTSAAAFDAKQYGMIKLAKSAAFEWVDVIRLGDRLASDIVVADVRDGEPVEGRSTAEVVSQVTYRNSYGGLIGSGQGTMRVIPFQPGDKLLSDRDVYRYSEEDIARFAKEMDREVPPRGKKVRYWNDVSVGEKLPSLCKPHLTIPEVFAWITAEAKPLPSATLNYFELKSRPGKTRVNPTTHWPYMNVDEMFSDIKSCEAVGFKTPVSVGLHRVALVGLLATDWMGDDGMLRRLEVELPNYYQYADTLSLTGEVVAKYEERAGGELYHAVDLGLLGTNQLGQVIARGTATVYLLNPGHPVTLPVPH